ncbi:MAG: Xaa-Pro peptidase family protein [Pseudomonadota bacterium]
MNSTPESTARGFLAGEFEDRLRRAQTAMDKAEITVLLLTTEPEIRYFSGFLTRFWESPTRPWFLIVPRNGEVVAVIPSIGAHLMGQCGVGDIRTWAAPNYQDDGLSLLADALCDIVPDGETIALPMGLESHLRMPLDDFDRLKGRLGERRLASDDGIMRQLRLVKSKAEIAKLASACQIAGRAFARVPEIARSGVPLSEIFRRFQVLCLDEGADWVPYLAGAAGQGGYGDVISPATETPLSPGDILMLDTGLVWDGYFCDFDRNFSVGTPVATVRAAHARLIEATAAGFEASNPGATAADVFHAMDQVLTGGQGGGAGASAGRLGHGLGMQLTEWPSLIPADHTVLEPGMVLTLEPSIETAAGNILVHEENIVVKSNGAAYLSQPSDAEIPVLEP